MYSFRGVVTMVCSGPCQWNELDRCSSHDLRLFAVLFKLIKLAGLSYKRYSKKKKILLTDQIICVMVFTELQCTARFFYFFLSVYKKMVYSNIELTYLSVEDIATMLE